MNRTGYRAVDDAVANEVRAEIKRNPDVSVKGIAEALGMRRATLSHRVNGHIPFAPSLLAAVATELGMTASEIVARAERATGEHVRTETAA